MGGLRFNLEKGGMEGDLGTIHRFISKPKGNLFGIQIENIELPENIGNMCENMKVPTTKAGEGTKESNIKFKTFRIPISTWKAT